MLRGSLRLPLQLRLRPCPTLIPRNQLATRVAGTWQIVEVWLIRKYLNHVVFNLFPLVDRISQFLKFLYMQARRAPLLQCCEVLLRRRVRLHSAFATRMA